MGRQRLLIRCEWFPDAVILEGVFFISVFVLQAKKAMNFNLLSPLKLKWKTNYSINSYFKDTLCAGPSNTEEHFKTKPHSD
jgi:hypothetical protein